MRFWATMAAVWPLLLAPGMPPAPAPETAPQSRPSTPAQAPRPRPPACAQGVKLGPIRVQLGAVEALTEVGRRLTLPVRVKGVCDLAAFEFWLQMDTGVAEIVGAEPAPFLAGEPAVEVAFVGLRPGLSRQTIAASRPAGSGGVDGIGTLARLTFVGRRPGVTVIRLVRLRLYDQHGSELPSQAVPVRLTVLEAGAAAPLFEERRKRSQPRP